MRIPGTSAITPVTIYLTESEPILRGLSVGFSFPKILFAVDSERTTLSAHSEDSLDHLLIWVL